MQGPYVCAYRLTRRAHLTADFQGKRHHGRARRDVLGDGIPLRQARDRRLARAAPRKPRPNPTKTPISAYVNLIVAHCILLAGRITEQFRTSMEGLGDVLPLDLLRVFDEHDLELLIGSMTEIDMEDWT